MKTIARFFAITLLGAASVAGAQINMPNPSMPGGSYNSAVRILATNDMMIDRQIARWIRTHYPGWDAEPHEFQELGNERYAVVYITSANNPGRRLYFRVQRSPNEDNDGGFPPL
jgi:hypothetical protein